MSRYVRQTCVSHYSSSHAPSHSGSSSSHKRARIDHDGYGSHHHAHHHRDYMSDAVNQSTLSHTGSAYRGHNGHSGHSHSNGHRSGSSSRHVEDRPSWDDTDGHYLFRVGEYLTDRYKIISSMGEGTFGKVVEAYDRTEDKGVAIKIIRAVEKYRDAAKIEIRVLKNLMAADPTGSRGCVRLFDWFEYRNHVCMVFEKLGPSLFDFLKANRYKPFSIVHIQHFARRILQSVAFLHDLSLIHTDLKPENLLLVSSEYITHNPYNYEGPRRVPVSTDVKLIDFGSATYESQHHTRVVSTRHYRAPEVILGIGWSYPCDIYSIGCILVELYTGEALFQTHDNIEHLAMMEAVFGPMPRQLKDAADDHCRRKYFNRDMELRWPDGAPSDSMEAVGKLQSIHTILASEPDFLDLILHLVTFEPNLRWTAKQALTHPFLQNPLESHALSETYDAVEDDAAHAYAPQSPAHAFSPAHVYSPAHVFSPHHHHHANGDAYQPAVLDGYDDPEPADDVDPYAYAADGAEGYADEQAPVDVAEPYAYAYDNGEEPRYETEAMDPY